MTLSWPPVRRRFPLSAIIFILFVGGAIAISWHVWITGHPTSTITCNCGDPSEEIWWLEWLPWAILHGHNPLFTNALYAGQGGVNSLANTSWLLPGLVASPITLAFGPI